MDPVRIELTKGFFALVDAEDVERVNRHSWCVLDLRKSRKDLLYAQSRIANRIHYLHRFVLGVMVWKRGDPVVDHRDGDGLNCQKLNLWQRTESQNRRNQRHLTARNTSGHNAIFWDKARSQWRVELQIEERKIYVGRYGEIEKAISSRDAAMKEHGYSA